MKNLSSRLEDIFLTITLWLAKTTKSQVLSNFISEYVERKTQKIQYEIIRQKWDLAEADKLIKSMR